MSLGIGSAQDANFESALEGMCLGGEGGAEWRERTAGETNIRKKLNQLRFSRGSLVSRRDWRNFQPDLAGFIPSASG